MFKNVAGQKLSLLAIDVSTNLPKTGDAANLTAYQSKDDGVVTALADTSATEKDATNLPGIYDFDLAQAETNANKIVFGGKSSTANIILVPTVVYTQSPSGIGGAGSGSIAWEIIINSTSTGLPISGCKVWASTDLAGDNIIAGVLHTDDFGKVTFYLDAGTYYIWFDHPNHNFANPQTTVVV